MLPPHHQTPLTASLPSLFFFLLHINRTHFICKRNISLLTEVSREAKWDNLITFQIATLPQTVQISLNQTSHNRWSAHNFTNESIMGNAYLRLSLTNKIQINFIAQFFIHKAKHNIHGARNRKNVISIALCPAILKTRGCTKVVQPLVVTSEKEQVWKHINCTLAELN